jgi:phosphohistidine phosphatase
VECILFRHGIALDSKDWKGAEALRPLSPDGEKKTRKAIAGLRQLGITPTHLWSSPLLRAVQTAELIRNRFQMNGDIQIHDALLPDAPPDELMKVVASLPDNACAIFVGHEPHLGAAASVMLFGKPNGGLSLKKAGSCSVRFDEKPKTGRGTLNWWLMPSQLRNLAST